MIPVLKRQKRFYEDDSSTLTKRYPLEDELIESKENKILDSGKGDEILFHNDPSWWLPELYMRAGIVLEKDEDHSWDVGFDKYYSSDSSPQHDSWNESHHP